MILAFHLAKVKSIIRLYRKSVKNLRPELLFRQTSTRGLKCSTTFLSVFASS